MPQKRVDFGQLCIIISVSVRRRSQPTTNLLSESGTGLEVVLPAQIVGRRFGHVDPSGRGERRTNEDDGFR